MTAGTAGSQPVSRVYPENSFKPAGARGSRRCAQGCFHLHEFPIRCRFGFIAEERRCRETSLEIPAKPGLRRNGMAGFRCSILK